MKNTGVLLLILLVLMAIYGMQRSTEKNPMIGTWIMKSGVYMSQDERVGVTPSSTRQMKVINDTHFTTIWQDTVTNQNMGFNGGVYSYEDKIYTEYLDFFSYTGLIGDTVYFKVDLEENSLSISECDQNGEISETGYFQEWERVE